MRNKTSFISYFKMSELTPYKAGILLSERVIEGFGNGWVARSATYTHGPLRLATGRTLNTKYKGGRKEKQTEK